MALRVLTQVNYSAGENAEGDSGLAFTAELLGALVRADRDLHFYVLIPERAAASWTEALGDDRITCIPVPLLPRMHGGDFQFDPAELYKRFDFRRYDVDVLFLNQPETAPAFLQFMNRQTFHNVPAVGYIHWFDVRRPSTPKHDLHRPALLATLAGLGSMSLVGCNSEYGRKQILAKARTWFNDDFVELLDQRMRILPPAVDVRGLVPRGGRTSDTPARILVNHRLLKYTGVRALVSDVLPRLWERRQDFHVHLTNPTRVRLPGTMTRAAWLTVETLPRSRYREALRTSDLVLAPHRSTHWSISTLEAICGGCVPLMNVESFLLEMMEPILSGLAPSVRRHVEVRWFYFRSELTNRLCDLLDKLPEEAEVAREVARRAREVYSWEAWTGRWLDVFRAAEGGIPVMSDRNPSLLRVKDLLELNGEISKEAILREFSWAPKQRALAWTSLRKSIQMFAPDDASAPEAVFGRVPTRVRLAGIRPQSATSLAPLEASRESG
ncbi:glycosyltransferase family protein [Methylobacterium radiotolerans]|uniref:hypothetical protein n=1 Tax=Methylobacterium radiotolerans TaxID=31998 RepID=UPI0038D22656